MCLTNSHTQPLQDIQLAVVCPAKENDTHTWAELSVVSDIMGQKFFLIQNDSQTYEPLMVLEAVYFAKQQLYFTERRDTVFSSRK